MKILRFFKNSLYLTAIFSCTIFNSWGQEGEFLPGFKKGFLDKSKHTRKIHPDKASADVDLSGNQLQKFVWDSNHSQNYNAEWLKKLFEDPKAYKGYYNHLLERKAIVRQGQPFEVGKQLHEIDSSLRIIPVKDDSWVKILLACCNTTELDNTFATLLDKSDVIKGSFFLSPRTTAHFPNTFFDPVHGYFSWVNPLSQQRIYRLYSLGTETDQEANSLEDSPHLGYCSLGYLYFTSPLSGITSNGFLLNKEGGLIEDPGFFVMRSNDKQYACYLYDYNPDLQAMAFYSMGGFLDTLEDTLDPKMAHLQYMLNNVGGLKRLEAEGAVFLPHHHSEQGLTLTHAKALLPYLYQLQQQLRESPDAEINTEALTQVIDQAEGLIFEEMAPKVQPLLEQQIQKEIESKSLKTPPSFEGTTSQTVGHHTPKKPHVKKTKKSEKSPIRNGEESDTQVKEQAKIRLLEKIRTNFLAKASEKHHYKTAEAGSLLGQLANAFRKVGMNKTENATTHGSHTALEMTTQQGHSFYLSLAKRSQKDGYHAGTLKTVVNDYVDRAIKAALNK